MLLISVNRFEFTLNFGHGLSFRRYVGLAFCDENSRRHIKEEILKLKLPGVYCVEKEAVSNNVIEYSEKSYYYKEKAIAENIKEYKSFSGAYTSARRIFFTSAFFMTAASLPGTNIGYILYPSG
jgi:hypothetical protein